MYMRRYGLWKSNLPPPRKCLHQPLLGSRHKLLHCPTSELTCLTLGNLEQNAQASATARSIVPSNTGGFLFINLLDASFNPDATVCGSYWGCGGCILWSDLLNYRTCPIITLRNWEPLHKCLKQLILEACKFLFSLSSLLGLSLHQLNLLLYYLPQLCNLYSCS